MISKINEKRTSKAKNTYTSIYTFKLTRRQDQLSFEPIPLTQTAGMICRFAKIIESFYPRIYKVYISRC